MRPDHCIDKVEVTMKYLNPFCGFESPNTRCIKKSDAHSSEEYRSPALSNCCISFHSACMHGCNPQLWFGCLRFLKSKWRYSVQHANAFTHWQSFVELFKVQHNSKNPVLLSVTEILTHPGFFLRSLTVLFCRCWLTVDLFDLFACL